jgi:hypothetical protein
VVLAPGGNPASGRESQKEYACHLQKQEVEHLAHPIGGYSQRGPARSNKAATSRLPGGDTTENAQFFRCRDARHTRILSAGEHAFLVANHKTV